jgi:hypothetical protein
MGTEMSAHLNRVPKLNLYFATSIHILELKIFPKKTVTFIPLAKCTDQRLPQP